MNSTSLATRTAQAQARIVTAVGALSEQHDLGDQVIKLTNPERADPKVAAMRQMEIVAGVLEKIAGIEPPAPGVIVHDTAGGEESEKLAVQTAGAPTAKPATPQTKVISYEVLRTRKGRFTSPADQDADGKPETLTRTVTPGAPTVAVANLVETPAPIEPAPYVEPAPKKRAARKTTKEANTPKAPRPPSKRAERRAAKATKAAK